MPYRIITHSGRAHIDELLASALLMLYKDELPCEILRLEHKEVERLVANCEIPEDTYVVDSGMKFDPEKRLFDHHQSVDMPSAALLVLDNFFPELKNTVIHHYFELVSDVDRYGENCFPDSNHLAESREYWKFSHNLMLRSFELNPSGTLQLIGAALKDRIGFEEIRNKAKTWMTEAGNLTIGEYSSLTGLVYIKHPPADIVDGLHAVDAEIIKAENISFVYGFDKEDSNIRTLFRTSIGKSQLDFVRSNPAQNIFTHQGGFFLKFSPVDKEEWKELVRQACLV